MRESHDAWEALERNLIARALGAPLPPVRGLIGVIE
jgi:hypothetical protein